MKKNQRLTLTKAAALLGVEYYQMNRMQDLGLKMRYDNKKRAPGGGKRRYLTYQDVKEFRPKLERYSECHNLKKRGRPFTYLTDAELKISGRERTQFITDEKIRKTVRKNADGIPSIVAFHPGDLPAKRTM